MVASSADRSGVMIAARLYSPRWEASFLIMGHTSYGVSGSLPARSACRQTHRPRGMGTLGQRGRHFGLLDTRSSYCWVAYKFVQRRTFYQKNVRCQPVWARFQILFIEISALD